MPNGDTRSQRKRYRDRYRGCRVCGTRNKSCTDCGVATALVTVHADAGFLLVVDGSFVDGHGGAGLVLVRRGEIVASRACGFVAADSSDAELQAVIRGARWAPGVTIYTDARELPAKAKHFNPSLDVRYLADRRHEAYALAHRLSVEGRCREAPETIPAVGIEFAAIRSTLTKGQRKHRCVDILLGHAQGDPAFDGDFVALAERIGWTTGQFWRENPVLRIAAKRWKEKK